MTRAEDRLLLTTFGAGEQLGAKADKKEKKASVFVAELREGDGDELVVKDRAESGATLTVAENLGFWAAVHGHRTEGELDAAADDGAEDRPGAGGKASAFAAARKIMPLPSVRERRLDLRLRASELVGLLEATNPADPEVPDARAVYEARLVDVGRNASMAADEARRLGLDPYTLRTVALDSDAGANLLAVASLPPKFSYSAFSAYEKCPLQYALSYVYRIPEPDQPRGALTFGVAAHSAFEAFTRDRRERLARNEPPPTREDLARLFAANVAPTELGDRTDQERYGRRAATMLDVFWEQELRAVGQAEKEELEFTLVLEAEDGSAPVRIYGGIDRIDRLPSGGVEVIDYKTGSPSSQGSIDKNLQLTVYALACRDALGLGTPERVTLFFTETGERRSTVRTDAELDAARAELLARAQRIRSGDFAASPGKSCEWCNYRALCPERA